MLRPAESELRSDAEGVPTNNQRERRSGPCRLCGGLDKAPSYSPNRLVSQSAML